MTPEEEKLYAQLAAEYLEYQRRVDALNTLMNDIARKAIELQNRAKERDR